MDNNTELSSTEDLLLTSTSPLTPNSPNPVQDYVADKYIECWRFFRGTVKYIEYEEMPKRCSPLI